MWRLTWEACIAFVGFGVAYTILEITKIDKVKELFYHLPQLRHGGA